MIGEETCICLQRLQLLTFHGDDMYLGIQKLVLQLQKLVSSGIYFMTTQSKETAITAALSCLYHNSNEDALRYLTLNEVSKEDILSCGFDNEFLLKIKAHVFEDKGKNNILKNLTRDFQFMKVNDKNSLLVVLLDEIAYLPYEGLELEQLLSEFSYYTSSYNTSLLFISFGHNPEQVVSKLLKMSQHISGICSILKNPSTMTLATEFWRSEDGAFAQGQNKIVLTKEGYEIIVDETNASASVDNGVCYTKNNGFTPDNTLFTNIKLFNDNKTLFEDAMKNAVAACIFLTLDTRDGIDELASLIYQLRTTRGKHIKIFVLEKVQGIRASSEHFLLICGANFLFDSASKNYYINAMMPTLKNFTYENQITSPFENLLESYHLIENESNGFLMPTAFIDKITNLLQQQINNAKVEAAFVWLEPKDSLDLETCISQFKPKRGGDYCTAVDGKVILFLPTCRNGELSTTLAHTFNTEPAEMFKTCDAVYTVNEIFNCVDNLKSYAAVTALDNQVMEHIIEQGKIKREAAVKAKDLYDLAQTFVQTSIPFDITNFEKKNTEDEMEIKNV